MNKRNMEQRSVASALEQFFGFKVFRHRQKSVIENVLSGKDCLLVAATGRWYRRSVPVCLFAA
jgi:superfamily II DNA helicase RecQ